MMASTDNQPVPQEESPLADPAAQPTLIRAAGVVLWRCGNNGVEIAVVHRPHYDDWSLPKGKLDPGELPPHAAVRETQEETGFRGVLNRFLTRISYQVPGKSGKPVGKTVDYFAARATSGAFVPNSEVDELRWLPVPQARELLSYRQDSVVLDAFEQLPVDSATVLLVRHAKAGNRSEWSGDDDARPLSEAGLRQRDALAALLPLYNPKRMYSAPRVRCTQTVAPVAENLGIEINREPVFAEEDYRRNPRAAVDRMLAIAAGNGPAVVCSQGGVIPDLIARLADSSGLVLGEIASKKASVWTLTFRRSGSRNDGAPALELAAADYLPSPLPATAD